MEFIKRERLWRKKMKSRKKWFISEAILRNFFCALFSIEFNCKWFYYLIITDFINIIGYRPITLSVTTLIVVRVQRKSTRHQYWPSSESIIGLIVRIAGRTDISKLALPSYSSLIKCLALSSGVFLALASTL